MKKILFAILISFISIIVFNGDKVSALSGNDTLYIRYYAKGMNAYDVSIPGVEFTVYDGEACSGTVLFSGDSESEKIAVTTYDKVTANANDDKYVCIKVNGVPSEYQTPADTKYEISKYTVDAGLVIGLDPATTEEKETGSIKVCTKDNNSDVVGAKISLTSPIDGETTTKTITSRCVTFSNLEQSNTSYEVRISDWNKTDYSIVGGTLKEVYVEEDNLNPTLTYNFVNLNDDSGSSDDDDDESSDGEITLKVGFGYYNSSNQKIFVEDIKYELHDSDMADGGGCVREKALITTNDGIGVSKTSFQTFTATVKNDKICLVLYPRTVPSGYELIERTYEYDAKSQQIFVELKKLDSGSDDGSSTDKEPEQPTVTTGTIKVSFVNKDNKKLTGVKYKLCEDSACKVVYSSNSSGTHPGLDLNTYYIFVTEVPDGYALPRDVIKITLNKDNTLYDEPIKLDAKISVPNTLLNASKVFTICGLVGMIAGISLLYFNAKKKEHV